MNRLIVIGVYLLTLILPAHSMRATHVVIPKFTVTTLTSEPVLWLRADALIGYSNGDAVSSWSTQTEPFYTFTQSGTARPTYTSNQINSLPALYFDGNDSVSLGDIFTGSTKAAVIMVVRSVLSPPVSGGLTGPFIHIGSSANTSHNTWVDGNFYEMFGTNSRKDAIYNPTSAGKTLATWRIISFQSASASWIMKYDGTQVYSTGSNTVAFTTTPTLGECNGFYQQGYIAELVVLANSFSSTDIEKVEGYLAGKYNLRANLPGAHPYAVSGP